jgi:hypothetical protein
VKEGLWEVQRLRVVCVEYKAGAKTAVVIAFSENLHIGIGSMAVTVNCDCKVV